MTARHPLVLIAGQVNELPAVDSLAGMVSVVTAQWFTLDPSLYAPGTLFYAWGEGQMYVCRGTPESHFWDDLGSLSWTFLGGTPLPAPAAYPYKLFCDTADNKLYYSNGIVWTATSAGGGGTASLAQATVDFGSVPVQSKSFVVVDAALSATSKVVITAHAESDELEMDMITYAALPGSGQMTVFASALPGPVSGTRKFNYLIG